LLHLRRDDGEQIGRRRRIVEDRPVVVLGELGHLELEVVHRALGLLLLGLQVTRGLNHRVDAVVLTLLDVGDEIRLANLRVRDAALPVEVRFGEALV
jgi:hypothetical protein